MTKPEPPAEIATPAVATPEMKKARRDGWCRAIETSPLANRVLATWLHARMRVC